MFEIGNSGAVFSIISCIPWAVSSRDTLMLPACDMLIFLIAMKFARKYQGRIQGTSSQSCD